MLGKQTVLMTQQSGIILPEPGVNVQAQVEAAINEVVSESREGEAGEAQRNVQRPLILWPTTSTTPAQHQHRSLTFPIFLPCLFPYGKGDFHINHPVTCPTLHDWAEHLLWCQDGRFARHKIWKFVVHNMIMRKLPWNRVGSLLTSNLVTHK